VSVVANYHKGEAFPFQLLIFLFTHNYLNTRDRECQIFCVNGSPLPLASF
jgi:hypothetical protein